MKSISPKYLGYKLLRKAHYRKALASLNALEKVYATSQQRIRVPFEYRGRGYFKSIKPMQSLNEITGLYNDMISFAPRRVVEIGTCHGGTLYLWCQASSDQGQILSIDLPEGEFGGGYHACRIPLYESFSRNRQKITLLRNNSHAESTFLEVKRHFDGERIDFLFIDGDHSYAGVKRDFEMYSQLVRPGGRIALHDILIRPACPDIEVFRFWQELKVDYPHQEFVEQEPGKQRIGIALIEWPG